MSEEKSLYDCIVDGDCTATLLTMKGCSYCPELRGKLEEIDLPFNERVVNDEDIEKLHIMHVPILKIDSEEYEEPIIIENETLEKIKKKLGVD